MIRLPFGRKRPPLFGLDIGSSVVKLVELAGENGTRALARAALVDLPHGAIAEGMIRDAPTVVEAVKEAVSRAGVTSRAAAIAVAGRELIIKKVQIPEVPPKEVHDAVLLEAEHHIPFGVDEVYIDYHVVGTAEGNLDLILVAVKKSKIIEYVAVVEEAGLEPAVVDIDGFALGNQFELNHPGEDTEAVALIDIGASIMKTNVLREGTSIFARDIPFGGNNYTQAIAVHLGISFETAEAAKRGRETGVKWDALVPALEEVSRELSLEVQRTFDYFASTAESERISRITLAGGCAQLPGLTDYLSSTWGIPVDVARPFERIGVSSALGETVMAAGPALAVAVGLALRQAGDKAA
ncbi:MAG: type IV pilus assembly protein PilM [Candidatus Rokubacteria bacterium]|nr:type IV pilus assembly protein PilM [Candidatus Rokubacteria bacterium]